MADRNTIIGVAAVSIAVLSAVFALLAIDPPVLAQRAQGYATLLVGASIWIVTTLLIASALLNIVLYRRNRSPSSSPPSDATMVAVYSNRGDTKFDTHLKTTLDASSRIDAIGIANNKLTSEASVEFYRSFLIERHGRLRIMFLDPDGDEIRKRETAEYRDRGTLSYTVKHNLEDIERFIDACATEEPTIATKVEVRLYDLPPTINAIIIDNVSAFVHYYGVHARGYDSPSLVARIHNNSLLGWYQTEFESLWQLGKPLPKS